MNFFQIIIFFTILQFSLWLFCVGRVDEDEAGLSLARFLAEILGLSGRVQPY